MHRHPPLQLLCCVLFVAVPSADLAAEECDARLIGKGPHSGEASAVVVAGDTAYLTVRSGPRSGQLLVLDVGDSERPVVLGYLSTPGEAFAVAVARGHAYVADGEAGLSVIDVADPSEPRLLRSVATAGSVRKVVIDGPSAYGIVHPIGSLPGPSSIEVFSLDDPRIPRSVGSIELPDTALGVEVEDGSIYVAAGDTGLLVVDVTVPAAPVVLRTIDTPGTARSVALWEGHALVADGLAGLTVVDLQSAGDPTPISIRPLGVPDDGSFSGIRVSDGIAYVTGAVQSVFGPQWSRLLVFDVADPSRIETLAIIEDQEALGAPREAPPQGHAIGGIIDDHEVSKVLEIAGGFLYMQDWQHYGLLRIGRLEERSRLALLGVVEMLPDGQRVAVEGSTAIMYGSFEHLHVIDVRRPERPAYPVRVDLAPLGVSGHIASVVLSGGLAHVSAESGLSILDMTAPLSPALVGSVEAPAGLLVLEDGIAYISTARDGLVIVDVSDPGDPGILSSIPLTAGEEPFSPSIAVANGYVYAASRRGTSPPFATLIEILDVRDPRSPTPIQAMSWSSTYGSERIAIADGFAYVEDSLAILVFDLADPEAPRRIGSIGPFQALGLEASSFTVDAGRAYVSFRDGSTYHLAVYDVEDPTREVRLDTVEIDWYGASIVLSGGLAFVPTGRYGVHIIDVSSCAPVRAWFRRGDANGDASIDLSDAAYTLNWLFTGGPMPPCLAAANANGDAAVDISDATYSLNYLFLGGPVPAAPFPDCGPPPDDEQVSCDTPPASCDAP